MPRAPDSTNDTIRQIARQYAGVDNSSYNASVNDPNQLTVRVNALNIDDPDTFTAGGPCTEHTDGYWVNVAAREKDIPSFFAGLGISAVPSIGATARVGLTKASTASGMQPFVLEDASAVGCVRATIQGVANPVALSPVNGSTTQWRGTAPNMPQNSAFVTVKLGCGSGVSNYPGSAYITRVQTGLQPQLTDIRLTPTQASSCTNANPYFIPRDGSPCQMQVTATVSFANPTDQFVKAQVGGGGAFDLSKGSGNDWSGTFTVNPKDGQAANNGMQPVVISAKNSADPAVLFEPIGQANIQAGRAANQGLLANVELEHHASPSGQPIGLITVTLRGLGSNGIEVVDHGADCGPGSLQSHFVNGCPGPYEVKSGAGNCATTAPFDCVGDAPLASLTADYDDRWAPNGTCTANNWPNVPTDDPRLTSVFLTDEIGGSPSGSSAITGFGAFYVTGWFGGPCNSGTTPDDVASGDVWGHFFKLVLPSADGTPGTAPCNPNDSAACIAVLVR